MRERTGYIGAFVIGAAGYGACELLWRGWTHWTMPLTGGLCAAGVHLINSRSRKSGYAVKLLHSCLMITAAEFTVGCIVNRLLGWGVWDYSAMPLNVLGQICPQYMVLWIPLAALALFISDRLCERVKRRNVLVFA